mmetsp:Transcript_8764/g.25990  ORF Transcript_8764/g.25990 Transcript_8764/m.25990 type:complete len:131 (+) Transcript_8764:851-1243(+)
MKCNVMQSSTTSRLSRGVVNTLRENTTRDGLSATLQNALLTDLTGHVCVFVCLFAIACARDSIGTGLGCSKQKLFDLGARTSMTRESPGACETTDRPTRLCLRIVCGGDLALPHGRSGNECQRIKAPERV